MATVRYATRIDLEDVRAPERTMGARTMPSLKSSLVRCSILVRFAPRGAGEVDMWRLDIVRKVFGRLTNRPLSIRWRSEEKKGPAGPGRV